MKPLSSYRKLILFVLPGAFALGCLILAAYRLLYQPIPTIPILLNVSPSLPYTLAIANYQRQYFRRGDFVIYSFHGPAAQHLPYLAGLTFFKMIGGVAGDRISVAGRRVYVNGAYMGSAKKLIRASRVRLDPIGEQIVPDGYYYMHGTNPDSFDSRYAQSGLVPRQDIIAGVTPLF